MKWRNFFNIQQFQYVSPTDGRPMPESERANDLFHWHTRLVTTQMSSVPYLLHTRRAPFLSGGPIDIPSHTLGLSTGLVVRDPTGHILQIVQR